MGSSLGEAEYGGIDETVGRLVWVRRRNGSWWPGQIMSVDELPKSCLLAAKPGTPVKLLGRDDASVDWYNLNKSKRVKAFRCGEFDNCIEKAKATVSTNKKSVKYARREDAIIRALEIENSYESKDKDNSKVNSSAKKQNGYISTNSPAIRENCEAGNELSALLKKGKLAHELARCGLSSAEPNEISVAKTSSVKGKRRKTPNDSEDDGIVGVKRMRGIKDLVLDVASKLKDEPDGESDQIHQDTVDKGNSIANESPVNSGKSNTPSFKKKRSAVVNGNVHESKRRKDRRRTLTKVLEECVMVSVPVTCDEVSGTVGSHVMVTSDREAVLESVDSEGVTSDFVNNGAEGADDQYENTLVSDRNDGASDPPHDDKIRKESGSAEFLVSRDSGSLDELYDVHLSLGDDKTAGLKQAVPSDLSGKREIDCTDLSLPGEQVEHVPVTNGNVPESDSTSSAAAREGISYEIMKSSSKWQSKRKRNARRVTKHKKQELKNIACGLSNGCSGQGLGLKQHLGSFSLGSDLKTNSGNEEITSEDHKDCFSNWGKRSSHREILEGASEEAKGPTRSLPYRHSRFLVPPKYEEADFPTRNIRSEPRAEPCLHDVRMEVNSTYRSNHVPIVSFMSKFNGKAIIGHPLTVDIMESGSAEKLLKQFTDNLIYKHCRRPRSDDGRDLKKHSTYRKGSKKDSSKSVTPSSKKTRRLSALTGSCKSRDEDRNTVVEKPRSSAIACIPLNVVFSRLNEAINGSKHHVFRTPSDT
uniref:PWWP domain-containing protein n=1 Tax=Kalanchoe fedtschenkoi TaxID=63787 RepID=A0A7N1A5V0_KALFE